MFSSLKDSPWKILPMILSILALVCAIWIGYYAYSGISVILFLATFIVSGVFQALFWVRINDECESVELFCKVLTVFVIASIFLVCFLPFGDSSDDFDEYDILYIAEQAVEKN